MRYIMRTGLMLGLLAAIRFAAATTAEADVIKLTSGRIVEGELTLLTEYGLTIDTAKGQENIMYNFIKEVYPSENGTNSQLLPSLQLRFGSKEGKRIQFY